MHSPSAASILGNIDTVACCEVAGASVVTLAGRRACNTKTEVCSHAHPVHTAVADRLDIEVIAASSVWKNRGCRALAARTRAR